MLLISLMPNANCLHIMELTINLPIICVLGTLELSQILETLEIPWVGSTIKIALLIGIGWPLAYLLSVLASKLVRGRTSHHIEQILRKVVHFAGLILLGILVLTELGFQLTAVLGAAGILSLAVGFAAQTSLSNLISGLFIYVERPFEIGDVIKVNSTTGVVLSIDLLSVKLRQFDNLFVRIPNETMIKTQVTNLTRFPIRRLDIEIGVAYKEDVVKVTRVLKEVADTNPYCLREPETLIVFKSFGDSSLNFMLGLWAEKQHYLELKNSIMREIKERFETEEIEIPFPQRSLQPSSTAEPFPIKIVDLPDGSSSQTKSLANN